MSTNIHIKGTRNAYAIVRGAPQQFEDTIRFNAWQTPTNVTYQILGDPDKDIAPIDKLNEYKKWVLSFDEEDGSPVEMESHVAEHLREVNAFCQQCWEGDYNLVLEAR